jgi:hypothetical protein
MFSPMTFLDFLSSTSLPEAGSGQSPPASPDGPTTSPSAPGRARAKRKASPAKDLAPPIQGICGLTFEGSSVPEGPLSSWENRLRQRLGAIGSTERCLIWTLTTTPQGRSLSRLAPSMRLTKENGCIGSPWTAVLASDVQKQSENPETTLRRLGKGQQIALNAHMAFIATFNPTPRASDGEKGGPNMGFGAGGVPLPTLMHSFNPTPTVADTQGGRRTRSGARSGEPLLNGLLTAYAPTPTEASGPTTNGLSPPSTEKRGAPNPEFPFWLMGFPDEWTCGALAAMQSFRSSRRKCSKRTSKPKTKIEPAPWMKK